MGRKNNVVSEYSVDYRRERLKYNKANYVDEYQLNPNRPVKKISHDDIKHDREIKSYNNKLRYSNYNSRAFKKNKKSNRNGLAIALLILLIASIAIVVTLVDTNFVIDMSNVFN